MACSTIGAAHGLSATARSSIGSVGTGRRPAASLRAPQCTVRGFADRAAKPEAPSATDPEPDFDSSDPLKVLGLPATATATDIKRAYYRLALAYHPDAYRHRSDAAALSLHEHRFRRIGDAYRAALARNDPTSKPTLTAQVANDLRRQVDEHLLGPTAVASSRRFFKWFLMMVGENYDTLIHDHLQRVRAGKCRTHAGAPPGHAHTGTSGGGSRAVGAGAQRDLVAAMDTFHVMLAAGERPTRATFEMLIRGCTMTMTQAPSYDKADHLTRHMWETAEELFDQMATFKLKPDVWTYNEMIRASGKAGHIQRAKEYFENMSENAFTLPVRPVFNSMLEACVKTRNYATAFEIMEEMNDIKRAMWFKGRYRSDAVSVGLLLKAAIEGRMLDKVPRILEIAGGDGLQPNDTTANRLLRTCVELGQLEVGREIRRRLRSLNLQLDSAVVQQLDAPTPTKR